MYICKYIDTYFIYLLYLSKNIIKSFFGPPLYILYLYVKLLMIIYKDDVLSSFITISCQYLRKKVLTFFFWTHPSRYVYVKL